jgi:hypothetical protein
MIESFLLGSSGGITMGNLPYNWDGEASRALRSKAEYGVNWATQNPGEWYNYLFEGGICYRPDMRMPDGHVGVYEIYGRIQGMGPKSFYRKRSDARDILFEVWTTELRSPDIDSWSIVETLKFDKEAGLF